MPARAVAVRWVVGCLAAGALVGLILTRPPRTFAFFFVFAIAGLLADALFRTRVGPGAHFSFAPTFTFVYFVASGGVAAAILEAVVRTGGWIIARVRRRTQQTALFGFFDVGQYVLAAIAAAGAVHYFIRPAELFGPVFDFRAFRSIAIYAAAYFFVHVFLNSLAVWARTGMVELRAPAWRRVVMWAAISIGVSGAFGIILWELANEMRLTFAVAFIFMIMAVASTMIRLNVGLRRGNEELRAMNRIGQMLSATLDGSELFRMLAREIRGVLPWDGFFIATVRPDSDKIQITFMTGAGNEIAQRTIPRGAGLTGRAIESGEMIVYDRAEREASVDDEDTIRGRRRPRSMVVAPLRFGDEILGAIAVQSFQADVYGPAERQLLETLAAQTAVSLRNAELFRREQLAIAERDEFLSLTTHEIKNPLTSIRGYLSLAQDAIRAGDSEQTLQSLQVVGSEALRIQRFAEDLLEISRIGGGKFTVQPEMVDPSEVVAQVVERYSHTSPQTISLTIAEGVPRIKADPVRLSQAVENLVSNAVKYSPEHARIDVLISKERETLRIQVRDEGLGIPEAKLPLIFERFYRVEEAGTTVKGTGLGLFITREIVRMHGGTIEVTSKPGEGSVFTVDLPLDPSAVLATKAPAATRS